MQNFGSRKRGRDHSGNWRSRSRDDNSNSNRNGGRHPRAGRSNPNLNRNDREESSDRRRPHHRDNRGNANTHNSRRNDYEGRRPSYKQDGPQNPKRIRRMGYNLLQELLNNDNIEDVVFMLGNDKKGFKELLEGKNLSKDTVVLVLQLLRKITECPFRSCKIELYESVLRSPFVATVINYVSTISVQTSHDKRFNSEFWKDTDKFWNNIIKLARDLQDIIPTSSCEVMAKLLKAVKLNIPVIESSHSIQVSDSIKREVERLYEIVEKTSIESERRKEVRPMAVNEPEPPDDFRKISVYPSAMEVTHPESPFLRPNVTKGSYRDVDHYLDVQFRLLREDFVAPLRKAICRFMKNPKDKLDDVKIYNPVQFLNMETVTEHNCFRIQYDFSNKTKTFQYENSRRFMFGALLCFTSDNFKTVLFAKVVKRDVKDLMEKGQLIVGFSEDVDIPENIYDLQYIMVESTVYFEPYYRVLNVLKTMRTENFPMERYIIRVQTTTRPPSYLLTIDPMFYEIKNTLFWPLDWGERRFYGLNESQNEAFKAALTREFSIIQGPPGTGKTFLGLKIAHTLLYNKSAWYNNTPILVICYTNHALDQFLEGLLPVTNNVIRVGGQSKNEALNNFNIRNKRIGINRKPAIAQRRDAVQSSIREISNINQYLNEIEKNTSVVEFEVFRDVVPNFAGSWFESAKKDDILKWLFSGVEVRHRYDGVGRQREQKEDATMLQANEEGPVAREEEVIDTEEDIIDDVFDIVHVYAFRELVSLKSLGEKRKLLKRELHSVQNNRKKNYWDRFLLEDKLTFEIYQTESDLECLQWRLDEGVNNKEAPQFLDLTNPYYMSSDERWQLYFYWLDIYVAWLRQRKETVSRNFRKIYMSYSEMRDMEDAKIMKGSLVVGMTTTGAARLQSSLQSLKSPIVIVEEAAEVLEAHIISSLTSHCKHLILIGDHQQLKPSTANFEIETKYRLGISLFERMVMNRIQCHTLNIQHRMRPEVSCLIRPSIYPVLEDHESVFNRPKILGVEHCVYFLDHQEQEQVCKDNSKKNVHEAKFLIQLARHLILNGYKPEDITILAAYLGQMFEMQREKRLYSSLLQDVRIAVLDNYQGEESNIILLSLVRSNSDNKIGFLRNENRVCVALSRARNGFYIMGNMTQLCNNSKIWPKIRETLKKQDAIGPHLTLRCQVHRHKITHVTKAEDFARFLEGGCDLKCEVKLECGHFCKRLCHVNDMEHLSYKCGEKCENTLCENPIHVCRKYCYEECGPCKYPVSRDLPCGHTVKIDCHIDPAQYKCTELVDTKLPCTHEAMKPCHEDPNVFRCPHPCDSRIEPCGHSCNRKCHIRNDPDHLKYKCRKRCDRYLKNCSLKNDETHLCPKMCYEKCAECEVSVNKKSTKCNHMFKVACNVDVDLIVCKKPCLKPLPCGHKCKQICGIPCGNCKMPMKKTVPDCNHTIELHCCQEPHRKYCKGKCPRLLPCGHACVKRCDQECTTECEEIVDCSIRSPCGHVIRKIACFQKVTDDPKVFPSLCKEPCGVKLKCEHACAGTCGECLQGRIHRKCQERCGAVLVCNHECPIPCRQACKPCLKPCEYRCKHSKCKRKCGDPCTSCREPCGRKCKHQRCTKLSGQLCDVPPCSEPCKKKLKCGHNCVGFCGDPCPVLCRICDREELTEIFLGREDEENAIYVMLEDCKHILESNDMEDWLVREEDEIKAKVCPRCKTTIKTTTRYSNYIKRTIEDITKVKRKFYGDEEENQSERENLLSTLRILSSSAGFMIEMRQLASATNSLAQRLADSWENRRQTINKMDLDAINSKTQILAAVIKLLKDQKLVTVGNFQCTELVSLIVAAVMRDEDSITGQEIEDVTLEIERLTRWSQFAQIMTSTHCANSTEDDVKQQIAKITDLLETPGRYNSDLDDILKSEIQTLKKLTASGIQISDAERISIVKAVGLTTGHWYKCPNGHPYVIGECGGAMQVSKCNECGVPIGGSNHRLLPGQDVATEMDGATYPAWSEMANMANYRL